MKLIPYQPSLKQRWDEALRASRFPALLLERGFMDYHADRFCDASLLFEDEKGRTEGLLAASYDEGRALVTAHGGLTYGGLVPSRHASWQEIEEMMQLAATYYNKELRARTFIYKAVPHPYWTTPAEEPLYWLSRHGATLKSRTLSSLVDLTVADGEGHLPLSTLRTRKVKHAEAEGIHIELNAEGSSLEAFWLILSRNLEERHGTQPVHTLAEIKLLRSRFPQHIRLALAAKGEDVLAGCLYFIASPKLVHAQYIASTPEGRERGALDLLFARLMEEMRREGYRWFDFGISTLHDGSGLNAGLLFQKEGFGARGLAYDTYELPLPLPPTAPQQTPVSPENAPSSQPTFPYLDLKRINESFEPALSQAILRAAQSGRYLHGGEVERFEQSYARHCSQAHCIATANGLDALTLALMALKQEDGWEDGDEVIVPAMTFFASALAVERAGLKPVFCDVLADTYLMDAEDAERHITPRTRCLLPVHLYGHLCDMPRIKDLADRYDLRILEDAAQAHGATDAEGHTAGHYADAVAYSFYPGKNLGALGDAGAVLTNSTRLAEEIRTLANYGAAQKYKHERLGLNSRMDEIQAAVLNVKMDFALSEEKTLRRQQADIYAEVLTSSALTLPYGGTTSSGQVFHVYALRCPDPIRLQERLLQRGVQTLRHYPRPLHLQPAYAATHSGESHPISEAIAREELSLPIGSHLSLQDVRTIAAIVQEEAVKLFNS